jgi:GTP-binding protein Era
LTEERVWLGLWVKQKEQWSEDHHILRELGYDD